MSLVFADQTVLVPGPSATATVEPAPEPALVSVVTGMMGGTVGVHVRPVDDGVAAAADARRAARSTLRRLGAWADRLTRFTETSDLARLNASAGVRAPVRPTLAAVLDWARQAEGLSGGIVDVALLDARLAAEHPVGGGRSTTATTAAPRLDRTWSMDRGSRVTFIRRPAGLRFDLDGVAKGWLADRALGLLGSFPSAVVDADGDIAIRLGDGESWRFGIADPRSKDADLLELDLVGSDRDGVGAFGLATSGTSVHRWVHGDHATHHLIDPRIGRPARTDIVQATVLAGTAREAEALAKAAVILGSEAALVALSGHDVHGAVLLTERNELLLTPSTTRWLA